MFQFLPIAGATNCRIDLSLSTFSLVDTFFGNPLHAVRGF